MSRTSLSTTARTIIKNRIKRHPDRDPDFDISKAKVADLIQAAMLLRLDLPVAEECDFYEGLRKRKVGPADAMIETDRMAQTMGCGGAGLAQLVGAPDGVEETEDNQTDENPTSEDAPNVVPASSEEDTTPEAKTRADVDRVMEPLAKGDVAALRTGIEELAARANAPHPEPAPARVIYRTTVDPSKVSGQVPTAQGFKLVEDQPFDCDDHGVDLRGLSLELYDSETAPEPLEDYVWPADTALALAALSHGQHVYLAGPAGTGKTEFARQIAAHWNRSFTRISFTGHTEAPVLVGGYGLKDGATVWKDGQLASAIRIPGNVILLDEPSFATPGALAVLQAVLDSDRALHVDETGEVIPVADDVLFIAADNTAGTGDMSGAYEGTRILNRAFLDRFALTVEVDFLSPGQEAALIHGRTGLPKKRANKLANFAAVTRTKAEEAEVSHGVGLRRLLACAILLQSGADPDRAFKVSVLSTAPRDDQETLRQLWVTQKGGDV
ncbi:MAG: AAA family ATPase [Pseudomonadota bacterium]